MPVVWLEGTAADFRRIRNFNERPPYGSEDRADRLEEEILEDGSDLTPSDGQPYPHRGSSYRKHRIRNGYLLFSRVSDSGDVEIFAVFHSREGWDSLIEDLIEGLQE